MRRAVTFTASTLAMVALAAGAARLVATAPTYTVEDLGTTADGFVPSSITGINANGQVSGTANQRPVRFTTGAGFEYLPGVDASSGVGNAINANGEVAGYSLTSDGQRAFRTGVGTASFVAPDQTGTYTLGWAINGDGVVAGYANTSVGVRAFRAAPGMPLEILPSLGTTAFAFGINDAGQVAGTSVNSSGVQHAYRANPDGTIQDLGSLSDGPSMGTAIDQKGDVVGRSQSAAGVFHAFRVYPSGMQDIDTVGTSFSNALAVSGALTVGTMTAADGTSHAFVHTAADGMVDLNDRLPVDSGWVLSTATGVNAGGQIVGIGYFNGVQRAYRLTPDKLPDTTAPVIASVIASPSTITPADGRTVAVTMDVTATDDSGEQPVCKLTGITGPGSSPDDYNVTSDVGGTVRAVGGRTYTFTETCTDAAGNHASATADVVVPPDTTPPTITSIGASPSTIWPPNGAMVTVTVSASATDDADPAPVCSLLTVQGPGVDADAIVTGRFTGSVRAVGGRTYVFTVGCADNVGNRSQKSVNVVVPPDTTAPAITSLSVTPASIWPANGKMVAITASTTAEDDVDASPVCALSSVTSNGGSTADAQVTGAVTAVVRATRNADGTTRVYTVTVTCSDFSGNAAAAATSVVVSKDGTIKAARTPMTTLLHGRTVHRPR